MKTESRSVGIPFRSRETVGWLTKDLAFRSEADIVIIRPSDTLKRVVWLLRAEVWRTKGYMQQIEDNVPMPGTTLLPPPGMTYTTRIRNIEACASEAIRRNGQALTEQEMSLLAGRDTTAFIAFPGHPRRDPFWRPTQLGWESVWQSPTVPKNATGRYVACLMQRGYQWPPSSAAKK